MGVKSFQLGAGGQKLPASGGKRQPDAEDPQPSPRPPRRTSPELGLILLVLTLPAWLGGARFTVDGAVRGLNWLLSWFGAPLQLPLLTGWALLGAAVVVGGLFTRAEIARFPFRVDRGTLRLIGVGALAAWLIVGVIDYTTTYVGLTTLPPDPWALHAWVASTPPAAVASAMGLTFGPELLFSVAFSLMGWRQR